MPGTAEAPPRVVASPAELADAVTSLGSTTGPVAVDAERAGSYRYGQRAYLLQFRRGSLTQLIDPVACPDLSTLATEIASIEWVLHAADQDLPCLAGVGLIPSRVFDTELAARLLGKPRVGLAALVQAELGITLAKAHSAADWSRRPLPIPWLRYAVMDVEHLVELRDLLDAELEAVERRDWAAAEFQHLLSRPPGLPRQDPWRRTSGIHVVNTARRLAIVRELWLERDRIARQHDRAPFRVLADGAIISAAMREPRTQADLANLSLFRCRPARRNLSALWEAITRAVTLPADDLPPLRAPTTGPPPASTWSRRNPSAAARMGKARAAIAALHEIVGIPPATLIPPDAIRALCWDPPSPTTTSTVAATLSACGARQWQVETCSEALARSLAD